MKISYLITCSTETNTLKNLLERVFEYKNDGEIIIVHDNTDPLTEETKKVLSVFLNPKENDINFFEHPLNANYGSHKNFGIEKCKNDWVFQLDGDELPSTSIIGNNLKDIIESNPDVECIYTPRINDFRGITLEHAKQWGWRLDNSPTYNRLRVNFPDFQSRIFKRDYPRISYKRKLHEKIEGYNKYSFLPAEEEYALYHDKTIEKQIETNLKYNKVFTPEENAGFRLP